MAVHAIEASGHAGGGSKVGGKADGASVQQSGDGTFGDPKVAEDVATFDYVGKEVETSGVSKNKGNEDVYRLKGKEDEVADSSSKKEGMFDSMETLFQLTGLEGDYDDGDPAYSLKGREHNATHGSKKKGDENGGQAASDFKDEEHKAASNLVKEENGSLKKGNGGGQAAGDLQEMRNEDGDQATIRLMEKDEATVGSGEKGDKAAGGLKEKDHQADSALNENEDEVGNSAKEGDEAVCGSEGKRDQTDSGLMKKGNEAGDSSSKTGNEAAGVVKEIGDETASGSSGKVDAGTVINKKDGETDISLKQSDEKPGSGSDTTSSTETSFLYRAEDTIVVVLHAFIEPDAWGIDSEDIQDAVHVYSDHQEWKRNCAKVTVR